MSEEHMTDTNIGTENKLTEMVKTFEFCDTPEASSRFNLILDLKSDDVNGLALNLEGYETAELARAKKATIQSEKRPNPMIYLQNMQQQDLQILYELLGDVLHVVQDETEQPDFKHLSEEASLAAEQLAAQQKAQQLQAKNDKPPAKTSPSVPSTAGQTPAGTAAAK